MNSLHFSSLWFPLQLMHICGSPFLLCSPVANADILFLLWFGIFSKYSSIATFENNGSLTISVSLSTNFMKSKSLGSLLWFCLIFSTFLGHLSLELPGNFDNSLHMMSGVLKTFQLYKCPIFSHFIKMFWNLWYARFDLWPLLISQRYAALIWCGSPYLSFSRCFAAFNQSSGGNCIQFLTISLASPFAYLIKRVSFPHSSSISCQQLPWRLP